MGEKGNGHDPMTVRMVEILERLETEVKGVREELGLIRADIHAFKTETRGALTEIHHEIADTNVRVTEIRDDHRAALATQRDLDARIDRLEAAVFKKAS